MKKIPEAIITGLFRLLLYSKEVKWWENVLLFFFKFNEALSWAISSQTFFVMFLDLFMFTYPKTTQFS